MNLLTIIFHLFKNVADQPNKQTNWSVSNFFLRYKHIIDFVLKKELVQFREYWRRYKPPIDSTKVIQLF